MSENYESITRRVLKDLVTDGNAPNGVLASECGALAEVVQALYDAYAIGGTEKVREVWQTLSRADANLPGYLASDEGEEQVRVTIHWAGEALEPQSSIDWLIHEVISAGSLTVVVGEPGSKKTWLFLDAAVCVALGKEWLGKPTRQATALVIDEESGVSRMNRRLGAVMRAHSADKDLPLAYVCMSGLSLLEDAAVSTLTGYIETAGAEFILIDALADVMLGGDENAVKDVQRVFRNLRVAANQTGAAIVVIHHANKAGGYRGSSAIKAAVDLMLRVDSKPQSPHIDMTSEKSRDTEPLSLYATARFEDEITVIASSATSEPKEDTSASERYVLTYLKEHGDSSISDIKTKASGCTPDAARQAVYSLTKKGKVVRKDAGGAGTKAVYGLKEDSPPCNLSKQV